MNVDKPINENMCQAKSLTRSTSVVMRVITCALLEKSLLSSFFSDVSWSIMAGPTSACEAGEAALEATSLRIRVLANKMEFIWMRKRSCMVVVAIDHS